MVHGCSANPFAKVSDPELFLGIYISTLGNTERSRVLCYVSRLSPKSLFLGFYSACLAFGLKYIKIFQSKSFIVVSRKYFAFLSLTQSSNTSRDINRF